MECQFYDCKKEGYLVDCSKIGYSPAYLCHEHYREKVNRNTCYFGDGNCKYPAMIYWFDMVFAHCFNGCKGYRYTCDYCAWAYAAYYLPEVSTCEAHLSIALKWLAKKRKRLILLDSLVSSHNVRR